MNGLGEPCFGDTAFVPPTARNSRCDRQVWRIVLCDAASNRIGSKYIVRCVTIGGNGRPTNGRYR